MSDEALNVTKDDLNTAEVSKRKRFVKLAESRTVKAIKAIRVIGKLSNRNAYDYGDGDVSKIVKALSDEVEKLKSRMKTINSSDGVDFKL